MEHGTIKSLTEKGFGFLSRGHGTKDLFFHAKSLQNVDYNDLQVGDEMEFDVEDGPKGPFAANVMRAA